MGGTQHRKEMMGIGLLATVCAVLPVAYLPLNHFEVLQSVPCPQLDTMTPLS